MPMSIRVLTVLSVLIASTAAVPAQARGVLNVATGAVNGTYATMFKNMGQVCTAASWLKERHTSGSIENVDLLLANQASLAFVQLDVLKARQQIDHDPRTDAVRTRLPLHREELHLLALQPQKAGGFLGPRARMSGPKTFTDLAGASMGAWGGSVVTARVLTAVSGVACTVRAFKDRDSALFALRDHQVAAVLAVVGQPAAWVSGLDPAVYALLPIDGKVRHPDFYAPANLLYSGFGSATPTLSVQSVLATRDFKSPDKRKQLLTYYACLETHLTQLPEDEGVHPKWQDIKSFSGPVPWPALK